MAKSERHESKSLKEVSIAMNTQSLKESKDNKKGSLDPKQGYIIEIDFLERMNWFKKENIMLKEEMNKLKKKNCDEKEANVDRT